MNKGNVITCSFALDRELYNAYKSIVTAHGENVKGNIVRYMQAVIKYESPDADTILAVEEVKSLKKNPDKKIYNSFNEILAEMEQEDEV